MHSALILPLISTLISSGVLALPYSVCSDQGNPNQRPVTKTVTEYATDRYITGVPAPSSTDEHYITGVPAPSSEDNASLTGVPAPSSHDDGYITGVPAPSSSDDGYITGVPAPSSSDDGYITGVPAPTSTCTKDGFITGVPAPSSITGYITGVPAPSSTGGPFGNSTSLPPLPHTSSSTESKTSLLPTTSERSSCRPTNWSRAGQAPSIGKLRAALIFVDFPDAPATGPTEATYSEFASNAVDLYKTMSYGKLDLEIVPLLDQFYRMPEVSSFYNYSRAITTASHFKYIDDAVKAAGSAISFTDIDVLYIMTNTEAKEISFSTSMKETITAADGTTIANTITYGQDLYFSWGFKTINHETGHTMGLPDLYSGDGDVTHSVGGYDMMGLIGGQSPDYFAWHKWQLDWIEDSQVDCVTSTGTTTHTIGPIEIGGASSSTKAVAVPVNDTAYIIVEARSTSGIDNEACGTGVLLYTADTAVGSGKAPVNVIDSKPGSGGCMADKGGELNDAPLKVGERLDTGYGVIVEVTGMDGEDYVIEVERSV